MDQYAHQILEKRIQNTMRALEANNMKAFYAPSSKDALELAKTFLPKGCKVSTGGSITLRQTGIHDYIENGDFDYVSRYKKGVMEFDTDLPEEVRYQSLRSAYFADAYFCSSNAITEKGELVNVDGQGNRVSAMIFGPERVIVVAGYNKIVSNIDAAIDRIEHVAAPANNARYHSPVPCQTAGHCVHCRHERRICCNYTVMTQQRVKDRVNVILVGEELGY